jgi:hypothetical protein
VKHLAKNAVVALCLLAIGAFSTWIVLRPRLPRGDGFTDGEQFLSATRTRDELRLARWDPPTRAPHFPDGARDPFVDVASGRLFFVRGPEGGEELWVASPQADGYVVRALTELNTPSRELAPAFHDGWLYFASDRPGGLGGLDLWRAPLAGDKFLAPENLGAPVNSAADEVDPAFRPIAATRGGTHELELWFASNRHGSGSGGDFDLWFARGDGSSFAAPKLAESTASSFDERGPAFTPDGRLLVFSSDRPDANARGGFDLWRSLCRDGVFQPAVDLGAPNSSGDETRPALVDDGFTLLYASQRGGEWDVLETRTRELFPVEAPRFTLADFTVLFLLALIALVAWLARRWDALDVLYKCMVVSLVAHLVFLWYSRRVDVTAEAKALTASGPDVYDVRVLDELLSDVARMEDRARGDAVGGDVGAASSLDAAPGLARASVLPDVGEIGDVAPAEAGGAANSLARSSGSVEASAPAATSRPLARGAATSSQLSHELDGHGLVQTPSEEFARMGADGEGVVKSVDVAASKGPSARSASAASAHFDANSIGRAVADGGAGDDAGLATRETAGAKVARAAPRGAGMAADGDAIPAATSRELARSGRVGGARDRNGSGSTIGARVAVAEPSDGSTTRRRGAKNGDGSDGNGGDGEPAGLALTPNETVARANGGDGGSGGGGVATTGRTLRRAGLAGSGGEGDGEDETTPRGEKPIAAGGAGRDGSGDGGALDGVGSLGHGPSSQLGPSGPRDRDAIGAAAVALATPNDARLGGDHRDGSGGPDGRGGVHGLDLTPSSLGGGGDGAGGGGALVQGPARARVGGGAGLGSGAGSGDADGDAGLAPKRGAPIGLPLVASATPDGTGSAPPRGMSKLYERRFGAAKKVALAEGGGSEETERAVLAGLRYLAKVQRPKGFFGDAEDYDENKYRDVRVGKTGLALLAFLGAGHTQLSKSEFSENVTRALSWLVARQDAESGHFGDGEAYGHGIATYALAECYAITKDATIRPALEKAVAHLLEMQQRDTGDARKDGGWTYYYKEGPGVDAFPRASISAWQVMALESAKVGGLEVRDDALEAAKLYFLRSFDPAIGGFRYTHNPNWSSGYGTLPASTPASMFALTLLGERDHARVQAAEEFLLDRVPNGYAYRGEQAFVSKGQGNVYYMYYGTLALFCRGGAAWRTWNDALKRALLPAQQVDGSWKAIDLYAQRYAKDDPNESSYSTAMCVLMLEVYYRYFTPLLGQLATPK